MPMQVTAGLRQPHSQVQALVCRFTCTVQKHAVLVSAFLTACMSSGHVNHSLIRFACLFSVDRSTLCLVSWSAGQQWFVLVVIAW